MLDLQQIQLYYPENLKGFDRFIIREYLQYKMLEIIFDSKYQNYLSFLGGTCLRIVYNNNRFSEDLDFDNFNLSLDDFNDLTKIIKKELERLGYKIELKNVNKGAYHCYVRFPKLLYDQGLSNHKEEKILIQLDTESHKFDYIPDKILINRFDVFTQINTTPPDILLAQKFYAVLNRKRNKGRDFYDIVYMLGIGYKPNFDYLIEVAGISTPEQLREEVLHKCSMIKMDNMATDVKPFLFDAKDVRKVLLFPEYIKQEKL